MKYRLGFRPIITTFGLAALGFAAWAQNLGYTDTPFLPGGKWRVHDSSRPQPRVIHPGTAGTTESPGRPPSDAIVLFDGKDLSKWRNGGSPAKWKVENGYFEVTRSTGTLETKESFSGDCQLHVEWMSPNPPRGSSQGRGNSGVFLMGRYEIQVLDNYESKTYADGQAASIYGQYPPLVNASRKPGEWQTYDILFSRPRFKDGKIAKPAFATVLHNGVAVHHHVELIGPMAHKVIEPYVPHGEKGPIGLQDHGDPVRFRNIWIRELKEYDQ